MLPQRFLLRNVDLWTEDGRRPGTDVVVAGGRIESLSPTGSGASEDVVFDGQGKALLPAGVDVQAHLRTPGQPHKETPATGLRAALRGGYAAIVTMPNTKPVIDSVEVLESARRETAPAEAATGVKVFWTAAISKGQEGRTAVDFEALAKAGIVAFTDDGRGVAEDLVMEEAFARLAPLGLPLLQHAEFPGHGGVLAPGPTQAKLGIPAYDEAHEWKMVERDLEVLARHPEARYHVLHVTSAKAVDLIEAGARRGLKATGEVSPHHLFFTSEDIPADRPDRTSFKMNPPLRARHDRDRLRSALRDGGLAFISTDQAPHEVAAKGTDFVTSAFGTTAQEGTLRVLFHLMKEVGLTPKRLVQVWASEPARFLGIESQGFGHLRVGDPFRAVWADAEAPARAIELGELESLSKNSCFLGAKLPGQILGVFNEAGFFRFDAAAGLR